MEYCNQGTLWGAAKQGLEEGMIRLYTRNLLEAVYELHDNGIVHRDIKGELWLLYTCTKVHNVTLCYVLLNCFICL